MTMRPASGEQEQAVFCGTARTMVGSDRRERVSRLPICGDGGGSNSPSKACARIASTSVVGDFDLAERGAHRHAPRSRQGGFLEPAYRPMGGPELRLYPPSRPAERRPGGRLTD